VCGQSNPPARSQQQSVLALDGGGLCLFCGAFPWRFASVAPRLAEAAKGTATPPSSANTNGHCQQALCEPGLPSALFPWRDAPLVLLAPGKDAMLLGTTPLLALEDIG
jgi:hypothetical protein